MKEKNITDDDKVERVIHWLTHRHLSSHGGYPYDYVNDGEKVYIAGLDDGKDRMRTEIKEYTPAGLAAWYDWASKYIAGRFDGDDAWDATWTYDFGNWDEALFETETP